MTARAFLREKAIYDPMVEEFLDEFEELAIDLLEEFAKIQGASDEQ